MQAKQAEQTGAGYWVSQIAVSAFAAIVAPTCGIVLFIVDEPGKGVMLFLIGIMFLACLVWLVRAYRRMSKTQRAVYAWAITQQHGTNDQPGVGSDFEMMACADKASKGRLTRHELLHLAARRPENPYPGTMPPAEELPQRHE
ncbi:hypothetical protein [Cryobacterium sp. N22]|uniref:hypothetical protein n=1 Tax=Cryobacterium sp. N22 TaxID=2048290 RepID=UPI000CE47D79|nr:hypothetical protein [Cryobacterium sp. N22]